MAPSSATSITARSGTATRSGTADGCAKPTTTRTARPTTSNCCKWLDANRPGKNDFQPWTKATHPTLGEVEVGGWNPKFWSQNPPPEMLETWAKNEAMFNLYLAQQLAQVRIVSLTTKPGADGAPEITAVVTNEGGIPTALEIAKRVKIVRPGHRGHPARRRADVRRRSAGGRAGGGGAGFGRGGGGVAGRAAATAPRPGRVNRRELGWLKPGEQRTVSWTVRGAGNVTVGIESTRGGVDRRTVSLEVARLGW